MLFEDAGGLAVSREEGEEEEGVRYAAAGGGVGLEFRGPRILI